ncbi:UBX domain-containing protein 4 [Parasteatoda tepidariorum]|uniref:UBX domain-containing protein 4 n=1 Tax=Parasteatoda tepidariorum TaxID=114398 RepID=UPI00077F8513|nr:UBX domain-containing protein 4 [Parasteatoda tepidariorum]
MQWHSGSIAEAVSEAKKKNKLFMVYIEGNDDMSKTMTATFNDPSVCEKLMSENVIALKLVANSVPYMQFCQIYPVLVIPSSFFIGGNGAPIEIITGSLLPTEFCSKLEKVFEVYRKSYPISVAEKSEASTQNSSINQPSTSSAGSNSEPSDTNQSLEDKVERAKVLIEAQRQSKAAEEKEKEKNDEIARRNMGKAMQQANLTKKETEMQEWAKNRAKDKEEERLAREKVKAMIAQDRAEQAARYEKFKASEEAERKRIQQKYDEEERARKEAVTNSNEAHLQFRLPDGSYSTHCFSADAILEEARRFVREEVRPPFSNFSLCTTFPRRQFSESDYSETLRNLQLAPSAVLLILPEQAVSSINQSANFISSMFWFLLFPITSIWNYIRSFFTGADPPSLTQPNQTVPSSSENSDKNTDKRQPNIRRRESPFAKREGNVFRINNQSDDDENNTWNGNSTQQM